MPAQSLTYYVGIYGDEQDQAVADVEKWLGSEATKPRPLGQLIVLETPPNYRHTADGSASVA